MNVQTNYLLNSKLSIITVNKNNFNGLLRTLNSLVNIEKINIEHLIIDGNSCNMSESFIELQERYDFKFISEDDKGIYDAMNKGIKFITGDFVLFLNSGDSISHSLSFLNLFNNFENFDLVYGNIFDYGQTTPTVVTYPSKITLEYMICGGLPHQATAIRKIFFDKVGFYDEKYKIISDWVFFMEALFYHNATYKYIPYVISAYEGGGLSSLSTSTNLILWEQVDYIKQRFPNSINYYKSNSPYVKKYLRQKSRIFRWFYRILLFKFNTVIR